MMLHAAFFPSNNSLIFEILSSDFQLKNRVALPPNRLPVVKVVLSYLKTNSSQIRSHTFRSSWRCQDTFCLVYQDVLTYRTSYNKIGYP